MYCTYLLKIEIELNEIEQHLDADCVQINTIIKTTTQKHRKNDDIS